MRHMPRGYVVMGHTWMGGDLGPSTRPCTYVCACAYVCRDLPAHGRLARMLWRVFLLA